jgi:hypothetical protein
MRVVQRIVLVSVLLAAGSMVSPALGQAAKLPGGPGLTAYAPKDAFVFMVLIQ